MNWKFKVLLQSIFSHTPFYGEHLNYFFQRTVTRSLPINLNRFINKVATAKEHIDSLTLYSKRPIQGATFYEFGAGWDLIGPLAFYSFGVEKQVVVDVQRLLRYDLFIDAVKKYIQAGPGLGLERTPGGLEQLERVKDDYLSFCELLGTLYGIEYLAPCNGSNTLLGPCSVDFITSTSVLEHVPIEDIRKILKECYRILASDGLMSFRINYQDHYQNFDKKISVYNFLKYSDRKWRFFNPSLHYQNRLRHRDYLNLFREAGFETIYEKQKDGMESDLELVRQLSYDKRFLGYSPEELAIKGAHVLLYKK